MMKILFSLIFLLFQTGEILAHSFPSTKQILYIVKLDRIKFSKTPEFYNQIFKKLYLSHKISTLCVMKPYPLNHKDFTHPAEFFKVVKRAETDNSVIAVNVGAPFKHLMFHLIGSQSDFCSSIVIKKANTFSYATNDGQIFWNEVKKNYALPINPRIVIIGANGSCTSSIVQYAFLVKPKELTLVDISFNNVITKKLTNMNLKFLLPDSYAGKENSEKLHELIKNADLIINGSGVGRGATTSKNDSIEYTPLTEKFCPLNFKDGALIIDLDYNLFAGNLLEQAKAKSPHVKTDTGLFFMISLNSAAIIKICEALGYKLDKEEVKNLVKQEFLSQK